MQQDRHHNLTELIDKLAERADGGEGVSVNTLQEVAGARFAGPLLFFPAMVVVSPLSVIPTLPTMVCITVVLIAGQIVLGRRQLWLPRRIREAQLSAEQASKVLGFMRPISVWIGKLFKPRLVFLVEGMGSRIAALVCILVALTMPPLELLPGASTVAGSVIASFGLAITLRDGVLLTLGLGLVAALAFGVFRLFG